jgi:hypothetical protein
MVVSSNGRYLLKPQPVRIPGGDSGRELSGFRIAQFVDFDMAVSEVQPVTAIMLGGGKAGERAAIIHGHLKEAVVDTAFMFVSQEP